MVEAGKVTVVVDAETKKLKKGMDKAKKDVKSFSESVKKMGLASKLAWGVATAAFLKFTKDAVSAAIKFETTYRAFTNMVGSESEILMQRLDDAARGTVSQLELITNANQAMLLGIDKEALPEMMEIARAAARTTGQDVGFMFQSIATGMGRQSRMILDNLGIIVKADDAYKTYADTLGKTVAQLTMVERRTAFNNAVLEAGRAIIEKSGASTETAADKTEQFTSAWKDFGREFGASVLPIVIPGLQVLANVLSAVASGMSLTEEELQEIVENASKMQETMTRLGAGLPIGRVTFFEPEAEPVPEWRKRIEEHYERIPEKREVGYYGPGGQFVGLGETARTFTDIAREGANLSLKLESLHEQKIPDNITALEEWGTAMSTVTAQMNAFKESMQEMSTAARAAIYGMMQQMMEGEYNLTVEEFTY